MVQEYTASEVFEDWDLAGLATQAAQLWPMQVDLRDLAPTTSDRDEITRVLTDDAIAAYEKREEELGEELMRYLERQILLQIIDNRWREHLYEMDYLREGIHLRGFAQIDPLVAYKNEGYSMFQELMNSIWEEFTRVIFHIEVTIEPADLQPEPAAQPSELNYTGGGPEQPSAMDEASQAAMAQGAAPAAGATAAVGTAAASAGGNGASGENPDTVVKSDRDKIGRNDPCWCGSGKKYKKCHGA
jgi:preprotein translocase subunit SecA